MACTFSLISLVFIFVLLVQTVHGKKEKNKPEKADESREKWKQKNIRDYNDADLERLLDQWEDADEIKLEEDELPEWKREAPKMDISQIDPTKPEETLKLSKKGRTLMMFVTVSGNPTEKETEQITKIWQSSLFNANYEVQRYPVSEDRVIFMLNDGAKAWELKDFLIQQDRCKEVSIEGKSYPGKGSEPESNSKDSDEKKSKKKNGSKKSDKKTKPKIEL